ncbi:hypothetical protein BIW11_02380 [Tropilaelaps mercedesae]|uniref:Lipocalin/cytosolic fatty-acid binding domain-containing protein n=1 Tax=Tropilaelaps mercedesae TaxID=418985 RepID=A0A1V9WYE9_9ACAR|nr:hypothetical protein BIW11_02380 [Tropilaelaps mercedesae]
MNSGLQYRALPWLFLLAISRCCVSTPSPPPKSLMDSFVPDAYQGKWFVELYTVKPIQELRGCLTYTIAISESSKKSKTVVNYVTLSNTRKDIRLTMTADEDQIGVYVVPMGASRMFEVVVLDTDYETYNVLWLRAGQNEQKHESIVVSSRTPGSWKKQKSKIEASLERAGVNTKIDEMGVIDNEAACAIQ